MLRWTYFSAVLVFWFAATGWLVCTKMSPSWSLDQVVPASDDLAELAGGSPLRWNLFWNERNVGWSETLAERLDNGGYQLRHSMRLQDVSVADVSREFLGPIAGTMVAAWDNRSPHMEISTRSVVTFDGQAELRDFTTDVTLQNMADVMRVLGTVVRDKLIVRVMVPTDDGSGNWREFLRHSLRIPPSVRMAFSLSPSSRYEHLTVGQEWNLPVYRLFPPNNPVQLVRARVENEELIEWQGKMVLTRVVTLWPYSGQAPTVSQQLPLGHLWVSDGGRVLRQDALIGQTTIRMTRQPTDGNWAR